jgi:[ribosomal protein S5]-alanine N-acetyltransferase
MRDLFPHPYTLVEADRLLAISSQQNPVTKFAIAVDDEAVGGIGLTLQDDVYRRSAEIGYWLGESFWGRGIITAAVRTITRFAFDTFDLTRIFANVFAWNPASGRVLEKAGYLREGVMRQSVFKEGQMIDAFLYAITRDQLAS